MPAASGRLGTGGGEYSFAAVPSPRSPARRHSSVDGIGPGAVGPRFAGGRDLRKSARRSRLPACTGHALRKGQPVAVPPWVWWTTIIVTVSVLLFDVVVIGRRPHEPSTKELTISLTVYVGLAVAFGIGVWLLAGHQYGTEFFAGWLTEYSLSIDNLFIFIIIMARFGVPRQYQQEALLVGIVLALVMRAVFIAVGAAAINE